MSITPTTHHHILWLGILLFAAGCSSSRPAQENAVSETGTSQPSHAAPTASPTPDDNSRVCAVFSAAQAQRIMGVAMQPKTGQGSKVCMYEEVNQRPNAVGKGTVALTLISFNSAADEAVAWTRIKEVRNLHLGEKNVKAASGIGDEAYFTGNVEKGKVGVSAIIARKGSSHFMLDCMVLEYVASPDALKAVAKEVTAQL